MWELMSAVGVADSTPKLIDFPVFRCILCASASLCYGAPAWFVTTRVSYSLPTPRHKFTTQASHPPTSCLLSRRHRHGTLLEVGLHAALVALRRVRTIHATAAAPRGFKASSAAVPASARPAASAIPCKRTHARACMQLRVGG